MPHPGRPISICASASITRATSTMVVARRISPNTCPCTAATSSHWEMSVYMATLGLYLGTTLAFFAWWTWALLMLLLLGYVLKALDEERFPSAHLAAAYQDYRRRVRYRLFPGVW